MALIGCLLLRSDVYPDVGDNRPFETITHRSEQAWKPRAGTQEYSPMHRMEINGDNEAFWDEACLFFGLGREMKEELRDHLQYALAEIDQISKQPTDVLPTYQGVRLPDFDGKKTLQLIGISLGITPFRRNLSDSILGLGDSFDIWELDRVFRTSPLFPTEVELNKVRHVIPSLKRLFTAFDPPAPTME